MNVRSLVRSQFDLIPLEIDLSLVPGLPQIQFLGLPDAVIRESVMRIKSAIRAQGFHLPQAQQVLVHLKPSHLKKSSRGLDLAVAAALLWKTGQLPVPPQLDRLVVYGELSLQGEVQVPDDLGDFLSPDLTWQIMTGPLREGIRYPVLEVTNLRELARPLYRPPKGDALEPIRPTIPELYFTPEQANLLAIIGAGEHSAILAGPPGTGKTTAAESLVSVMSAPDANTFLESQKINRSFGQNVTWRPLVNPHHTITPLAMIGGGSELVPGEITRAHGGLLVLDEFLEFDKNVHEALREPVESGSICLARRGHWRQLPARFLLIATSNLCPCGQFVPGWDSNRCHCSNQRRVRYLSRFSGPVLDRFEVLAYTHKWSEKGGESLRSIEARIQQAQKFASQRSTKEDQNAGEDWLPTHAGSRRRHRACLRVARTIADLESSEQVKPNHLEAAARLTLYPFEELKKASRA